MSIDLSAQIKALSARLGNVEQRVRDCQRILKRFGNWGETRLLFYGPDREFISCFNTHLIPQVGQVWKVPNGDHNYEAELGYSDVKILAVKVLHLSEGHTIDIEISCSLVR